MKRSFSAIGLILALGVLPLAAQPAPAMPDWSAYKFVLGDWVGEASGEPGQGSGGFSFAPDLQGRVLIRHSRTEFPATQGRPAFAHDDILVVYQDKDGTKADYWDNEGHVIHYDVTVEAGGSIAFVSPKVPGAPRQKLTYRPLPDGKVAVSFALAPPDKPDEFKIHVEGISRKK